MSRMEPAVTSVADSVVEPEAWNREPANAFEKHEPVIPVVSDPGLVPLFWPVDQPAFSAAFEPVVW
jgi:hypothetical protein